MKKIKLALTTQNFTSNEY